MNRVKSTVAITGLLGVLSLMGRAFAQKIPDPPPPTPPKRSAHAVLRGGEPDAKRGHGVFREVAHHVKLVLNATDSLPGEKTVSLMDAPTCDALEEMDGQGRDIGRLTIDDDGRGRMTTELTGVSIEPDVPNTIIGSLLVIHASEIESCGEILSGRLRKPVRDGEQARRSPAPAPGGH